MTRTGDGKAKDAGRAARAPSSRSSSSRSSSPAAPSTARASSPTSRTSSPTAHASSPPSHASSSSSFDAASSSKAAQSAKPAPGATVPASLRSDLALLSEAGRADVARLFFLHGGDRAVRKAMTEALAEPHLWCVPMRANDERRVLAAAIACVPVSSTPARRPDTATFLRGATDGRHAVPDALARVAAAYALGDDVTIAPEWWFVPSLPPSSSRQGAPTPAVADGIAHSVAAKDALIAELAALTQGSDRLLVPGTIPWRDDDGGYHNTAYAFANGQVLHEVDKRGDGDDVDIATAAGLTYASRPSSPMFQWRGLTTSLEVCRDHGDARLRWDLLGGASSPKRDSVDLQLVVSSGVWLKHVAAGVGGAILVAQGDGIMGPEAAVRTKDGIGEPQSAPAGAGDPWRVDLRG